jgi:hypothetical protein
MLFNQPLLITLWSRKRSLFCIRAAMLMLVHKLKRTKASSLLIAGLTITARRGSSRQKQFRIRTWEMWHCRRHPYLISALRRLCHRWHQSGEQVSSNLNSTLTWCPLLLTRVIITQPTWLPKPTHHCLFNSPAPITSSPICLWLATSTLHLVRPQTKPTSA